MLNVRAQLIRDLYYADYGYFFSKPNVVGIAYGYKITNWVNTCEPSIHVYVEKKMASNCIAKSGMIPPLYKGVKTDVIETGKFISGNIPGRESDLNIINNPIRYTGRIRPIEPGWSMSTNFQKYPGSNEETGTFGYIATDNEQVSKTYCLLSANKTFADYNKYPIGGEILQPSFVFNGRNPQDTVAKLLRFTPLVFRGLNDSEPPLSEMNEIDASVASLVVTKPIQLINPFIPPKNFVPRGIVEPELGIGAFWTGCFSGYNSGNIGAVSAILKVIYKDSPDHISACWFKDVILGEGYSVSYDEGSLVTNLTEAETRQAMGLLFASSSARNFFVFSNIRKVQEILNINLLTY